MGTRLESKAKIYLCSTTHGYKFKFILQFKMPPTPIVSSAIPVPRLEVTSIHIYSSAYIEDTATTSLEKISIM
jgi:hypothetical protein